ncbi:hypothetical protein UC34_16925 [Pandoraea vervacti]|uniref:Intradiol ring-cleavage dioxygenases domain-containing protein n=1 Tax=Pandoraea vervacti TaxID=656178 RepID=A0ABM5T0M1_9BURK|nr:hypothetical protein [Pandoraea vervacti]AJP58194.1 hypothetical protein UC34_16925 [Pandoraea vervacti]
MSILVEQLKRIGALQHPIPADAGADADANANRARVWRVERLPPARADVGNVSAVLKRTAGGERREYVAERIQVSDDPIFGFRGVMGLHFASPPHEAHEERVSVLFRRDLPNGSYLVGDAMADAPAAVDYGLYFRNPPYYPDGDMLITFEIVTGKLILENRPEAQVLAGRFENVLVKIHKVDHLIGIGPDTPYELTMLDGRFEAAL